MTPDAFLERLRPLCLAFPEARETTTFGNPTFQAGTKSFALKRMLAVLDGAPTPTRRRTAR